MASCEKCWIDSHGNAEQYERLLRERNESGNECTPEQQAGPGAYRCPVCLRQTIHVHCGVCMVKGCQGTTNN